MMIDIPEVIRPQTHEEALALMQSALGELAHLVLHYQPGQNQKGPDCIYSLTLCISLMADYALDHLEEVAQGKRVDLSLVKNTNSKADDEPPLASNEAHRPDTRDNDIQGHESS